MGVTQQSKTFLFSRPLWIFVVCVINSFRRSFYNLSTTTSLFSAGVQLKSFLWKKKTRPSYQNKTNHQLIMMTMMMIRRGRYQGNPEFWRPVCCHWIQTCQNPANRDRRGLRWRWIFEQNWPNTNDKQTTKSKESCRPR